MAEIMSRGNAINSAITDAILMILQTLLKLRESENRRRPDCHQYPSQRTERRRPTKSKTKQAGKSLPPLSVARSKQVSPWALWRQGLRLPNVPVQGGGSVDQQLAIYNARMNQVNAVSGIGGAVADTSGGTLGGISKEEEAESKTKEAQAQQAGATEQKVAKEEETMRQFIQQVLQMISQIVDSEHQSKSHINA